MTLKINNSEVNLSDKQKLRLFKQISQSHEKVSKDLQNISDQIAKLDNEQFMLFRRSLVLELIEQEQNFKDLFDLAFDLVLANDDIKKLHVAMHEEHELKIDLFEIFSNLKKQKSYKKFLLYFEKQSPHYHQDPSFLLFIGFFVNELAELFAKQQSWFFSKKRKVKSQGLALVLHSLGYTENEALRIVAHESGMSYINLAELIIKAGAEPDAALDEAIRRSDIEFVDFLLKKGANANLRDGRGETLLDLAISRGEAVIVSLLLSHGAKINDTNASGETPLLLACQRDDLVLTCYLLKEGADVNLATLEGKTPFLAAIEKDDIALAFLLLQNHAKYRELKYFLQVAMRVKRAKYIEILIELKNLTHAEYKEILLENIPESHAEFARYLSEYEAAHKSLMDKKSFAGVQVPDFIPTGDIPNQISDNNNFSVPDQLDINSEFHQSYKKRVGFINTALEGNHHKVAEFINDNLDVNHLVAPEGLAHSNLLHIVVWQDMVEVMLLLIKAGVPIDVADVNGDTPIYLATFKENFQIFSILLERGADIYKTNNYGLSAYDLIRDRKLIEFSSHLRDLASPKPDLI